jgi:hypothetical protein
VLRLVKLTKAGERRVLEKKAIRVEYRFGAGGCFMQRSPIAKTLNDSMTEI